LQLILQVFEQEVLSLTTSICHGASRNGSCWGDASVIQGQSVLSVISWMASEIFNLSKLMVEQLTMTQDWLANP
jgi:hypothetical protein